jgi:hypothetical protein
MHPVRDPQLPHPDRHIGAVETQVDMKDTVPQRIDKEGHKIEDLCGTGEHDSQGG